VPCVVKQRRGRGEFFTGQRGLMVKKSLAAATVNFAKTAF